MAKRAVAVVLGLALLTAGCATVIAGGTRTETKPRPARPADYPIALLDETVPARPHKVIGSVRARVKLSEDTGKVAPPERVVATLRKQARLLGGDALLPITTTAASGGGTYLSPTGHLLVGNSVIWNALVIVWLDE